MMNEMESEFTGSETGQECIPEEKNCQDIAGHSEKYDETRIAFGERLMANLATNENLMRKQMRYFQIAYETDEIQQIGILPFLSGCAFDRVLFRVLVRFPNAEFFLIPVVYRTFKMPQRYYDDLKRGRLKDAISYKNGARALRDGRERRWEISRASWPKKLVEIYGTWLAESQHEFLSYTRAMCYGLIERLNLLDCNPIRSVQEEKSGEYYHLTGWRRKSEGELRFDGVKRRMYCFGYLGTPSMIFYMKRYDRNEWFKGSVQHTAVSFCQLWLCAPSLLLAAAYGILTILPFQRPPKNIKTESGEIALVESMPLPVAMIASGMRRESLKAMRVFADTNFTGKAKVHSPSWLSDICRPGTPLWPYVVNRGFDNISYFEVSEESEVTNKMLERLEQLRLCGISPIVWMPAMKQTAADASHNTKAIYLRFTKRNGSIPKYKASAFNEGWKMHLLLFIEWLEDASNEKIERCTLKYRSYSGWRSNSFFSDDEKEFLRIHPRHGALLFALECFLQYWETEYMIERDMRLKLCRLCFDTLVSAVNLFDEPEFDKIRRYFAPAFDGGNPAGSQQKPPYLFWNGQERGTKEKCFYIEANRWMEDYRRRTKSSASDTEIMGYLKPFLICRPDGKALGMQRVYKKDGESKGRKIYVLCIRKKDFLKR